MSQDIEADIVQLQLLRDDIKKIKDENNEIKKKLKSNNEIINEKERKIKKLEDNICLNKYGFLC